MGECHKCGPVGQFPFVVTGYHAGDDGRLVPCLPVECPLGASGDGGVCVVGLHHWRERKTGPEFPLAVVACSAHRVCFTLYPPGFVPYGRTRMAPVDLQGQRMAHAAEPTDPDSDAATEGASSASPSRGEPAWELTWFRASMDAADGIPWPRRDSAQGGRGGSWRTQGRHLELAARLLGVSPDDDSPLVGMLAVPTLHQRDASSAWAGATGYRSRGWALARLVSTIQTLAGDLLTWLLGAGFHARLWGHPWRCQPLSRRLVPVLPRARSP